MNKRRTPSAALIRHLVWHDVRSQRYVLAAFVVYLLLEAALLGWVPPGPQGPGRNTLPWQAVIRFLLTAAVTALVVQQDMLVGTTAFWRTRPMSRLSLLVSKAVTLLVSLVMLPGLLTWLNWAHMGLSGPDAASVAVAVMLEQAVAVLLTAMAAAVTPTLTYLVVAGVAGVTMVSLFNGVLLPALLTTWPFVGQSLGGYRPAVYLTVLFVLGIPAVAHQYLTLRDWRTAMLVAVAVFGATGAARLWPDAPPPPIPPVNPAVVNPADITATFQPQTLQRTSGPDRVNGVERQRARYLAVISADGQPDSTILFVNGIESRLLLPHETVLDANDSYGMLLGSSPTAARHPYRLSMEAALAPATLPAERTRNLSAPRAPLLSLPLDRDLQHAGTRALLTSRISLVARRFRVTATTPVTPGARLRVPGMAVEILSVAADGRTASLGLRIAVVENAWPGNNQKAGSPLTNVFVLRNNRRRQAVEAGRRNLSFVSSGTAMIGGVGASLLTGQIMFPGLVEAPYPLDSAWLQDAELVCLSLETLGSLTRQAQMEIVMGGNR